MKKIHELRAEREKAYDAFKAHASKKDFTDADQPEYDRLKAEVEKKDAEIKRAKDAQALAASTAQPAPGQEIKVPAAVENDKYVKDKSLVVGGMIKMMVNGGGNLFASRHAANDMYGERHPVTKALITATGSAGGFIVPPDVASEVIELLRPKAQVRAAGPRNMPMPRGTMTLPGQASAGSAFYGSESKPITKSQPGLRQIVASYKKLTALTPVSNDMMRYSDPAVDAFIRDDMVKYLALREDLAFLLGDGTQDTPRGFLSFANGWVIANGGTAGSWSTSANSVMAVNGADPANSTGGNFITSNPNYTLATVAAELGGAVNRLDTANVAEDKRAWFMHPRSRNYLFNVQNSLGNYVYREELMKGTLFTYPVFRTTQLGNSYWDATGTNKDLSFVFLAEMTEAIVLDSMQLQLAVSQDGTYIDEAGASINAFQYDQTVIRAIAEHDFQLRHDQSVAVIQGVRWAPAIS